MESTHVVLDISSDEDYDYDWISEFLDDADDSDEVVVVSEVVANHKQRSSKSSSVAAAKPKDLDDDCVVLEGDPDKPVAIEIENNTEGDSDDLSIVGEKGQIACRDYPHARHLCAKFPFTSSLHERHCPQCHCYVCDSLAPCVNWGNGTSRIDHCHATDKDEFWKFQRQSFKQGNKAPLPVPKFPDTSLSIRPPPTITQLQPKNQISRSATIRACSMPTSFGVPNITDQGRSQQSVYVRNKFHPDLVSRQLLSTRNNIIRRDRRFGNSGPPYINSHTIFKRAAGSTRVALATNRTRYGSSDNNYATQFSRNPSPVAASNDNNPTRWRDLSSGMISDSEAYQNLSQQNTGSSLENSVPSQPLLSSHPNMGSVFLNSVPSGPRLSSQPNIGCSFVDSVPSPQVSSQPSMGSNFENPLSCQPQVSSRPNMGSSFVYPVPSQPQVYSSQPIPAANDGQYGFQQVNETQSAVDPSFSDFDSSWVAPTGCQSNQPLADNSLFQIPGPTYHHPPLVTGFDPQIPVNTNPGLPDFQFDWMLENQSFSGALEVPVPSGCNVYSPETAPVDDVAFFDF
ncbi:unnamed protein product [Camellia sinensis]